MMATHEHDWHDITVIGDVDQKFVCTGCDARRTGEEMRIYPDSNADELARNDGWDGMRKFLRQMGEGYER